MAIAPSYVSMYPDGRLTHAVGDLKESMMIGTIGASDTYVTGGWALSPATFGLQQIIAVDVSPAGVGHPLFWNAATGNIQAFSAAGTELVNASAALQNAKFNIIVRGK